MTDTVTIHRELLEAIVNTNVADYEVIYQQKKELRAALAAPVQDAGEAFCDGHCTWLDHQPGCPRAAPVQGEARFQTDDRSKWTVKDWYSHLGARENDKGQLCFGSTIAFAILLEQFHAEVVRQYRKLSTPPQPAEVGELVEALRAADEYLSSNRFNEIGSGSILHRQMQDVLAKLDPQSNSKPKKTP